MAGNKAGTEQQVAALKDAIEVLLDTTKEHSDQEVDNFLRIFFDFARKPITEPHQLEMLQLSIAYFVECYPERFGGSIEDAIDDALEEAIDQSTSPAQTGLLALVRYIVVKQRGAATDDLGDAESAPIG